MKSPRRAASVLAAFLMAVSLVAAPQRGRAVPIKEPVDYVPPPREGEPDEPGGNAYLPQRDVLWIGRIGIMRVGPYFMIAILPHASHVVNMRATWFRVR